MSNQINIQRILFFILITVFPLDAKYSPPKALVEPLKPAGLRISIPHEKGISLVAFHININEEFNGIESGKIAVDILKPKNNRWTYEDAITVLEKDDIINYWIYVIYEGLGYNILDQEHKVISFFHSNGNEVQPVLVQALKPAGLRISVADVKGISLVSFHININEEFNGVEAGMIARDIHAPKHGRWTYHDKTTALKENDVIYYWIHTVYKGLGYNMFDQQHVVTEFHDHNGTKVHPWVVKPLNPIGLRISVPHTPGISLVAFHINVNEEFNGLEAGQIAVDIQNHENGFWTYEDKKTKLKKNDIIYFWIHTVYNGLGYNLLDQQYTITELFSD